MYTDATLQVKAANQFYQTGNSVREQSAGALLPAQTCAACGTAVGLCYSSASADDVCCTGCTFTSYTSSVVKQLEAKLVAQHKQQLIITTEQEQHQWYITLCTQIVMQLQN